MSLVVREREQDDEDVERYAKRAKLSSSDRPESFLPPSLVLLGISADSSQPYRFSEPYVGISEYVGHDIPKIHGIIKQRFTDFLVFEVDQNGNIVHLQSLDKPQAPPQPEVSEEVSQNDAEPVGWGEDFSSRLSAFLPEDSVEKLREMYLEGPEPPQSEPIVESEDVSEEKSASGDKGGRGRGGRGTRGRGRGRGGRRGPVDNRKVVSPAIASKDTRTDFHKAIRDLFRGKLETETDTTAPANPEEGSRIIVKWAGRGGRGGRSSRGGPRSPQYIHFSMQKTNRDTQDALSYLSRTLHVDLKDLSVAGTKDKRGVTVQRVSLRCKNKTPEDVWRMVNGLNGRRTRDEALKQRGDRGLRIADLSYHPQSLELGMLKGNSFVITLRNVEVDSLETVDRALEIVKRKGFINYYGMQRFGTSSVPTHSIGLALLKSDWQRTIDLIMYPRFGEQPEITEARNAWLVDHDVEKALEVMPRKVVAERCILEFYKKNNGDTRDALGALKCVPKTLRLMYIHAYQSYVWNAIVSERLRTGGLEKPIVGDLVMEHEDNGDVEAVDEVEAVKPGDSGKNKSRKPWTAPKIKTLTEEDLDKYTIFDVVIPLPGTDVAYPGGTLGEKYRQYLHMDGLNPDDWTRKQKEYTLNGAYRKIFHLPKDISWKVLRYTDPDYQLAQSDEDKLIGLDPPPPVEDGKFMALQVELTLGTAAYATMALREITKTDTSTQHQIELTSVAPDQKERQTNTAKPAEKDGLQSMDAS